MDKKQVHDELTAAGLGDNAVREKVWGILERALEEADTVIAEKRKTAAHAAALTERDRVCHYLELHARQLEKISGAATPTGIRKLVTAIHNKSHHSNRSGGQIVVIPQVLRTGSFMGQVDNILIQEK
ncbi:MAG: hypothetical protein ACE5EF_00085 [Dehalococcoidia bacterium]